MIRKFECNDCKTRFDADDAGQVRCPNCNLDNVEYASFHVSWKVAKIIGLVIAILCLIIIMTQINWRSLVGGDDTTVTKEDSLETALNITYINETGLSLPPVINVSQLTFEDNGYTFEVSIENAPTVKYQIAILDPFDNKKIIAQSEDGKFKNVPYSNADGGVFDIAVIDVNADSIICKIDKPGFIMQRPVDKKMTVSELQAKIDRRDLSLMGVGKNDYLNPEYNLKLIGLPNDAVNIPSTLGEVFDKLDNEIWSSVKVVSLDYDDKNRITRIELSIKE